MKIHGVELDPAGDMVVQAYKRNGYFESVSMALWQRINCLPGCVAVDVGAYTGLYAIAAAMAGSTTYAFEPNPANYERMAQNLQRNEHRGVISLFCAAVSSKAGKGELWDTKGRPTLTSAGKVCPNLNGSVELLTIDELNLPRCDVIKADVEGAELDVLRGARRTIAGYLPRLILEANTQAEREALDNELNQYGYGSGQRADVRNLIYTHPDR